MNEQLLEKQLIALKKENILFREKYRNLSERAIALQVLQEITLQLTSELDMEILLKNILNSAIKVVGAAAGSLLLLDKHTDELVFKVVSGGSGAAVLEGQCLPKDKGIAGWVLMTCEPLIVDDVSKDKRFYNQFESSDFQTANIICVPLITQGNVIGVFQLLNKASGEQFNQADLELLTGIASSAVIALVNAQWVQMAVEKGRLERELQVAHQVQTNFLPNETPQVPGWEFIAHWQPAREVAGDYYDFIPLDREQLGLVIADVSGKGMPAALFMTLTRSIVRASVVRASLPVEGIAHANRLICADSTQGMFVTLFYGLLNPATREFTYVNGGHNPPLLCRANQDRVTQLTRTGMALGVIEDTPFEQHTVRLNPDDLILLYTDGVPDATDAHLHNFGMARLQRVILEHRHAPTASIMAALVQAIGDFAGSTAPFDDIAMVILKCLK